MKQPDSEALRTRRHRAHKRGDHALCRPGACPHVKPESARFQMPATGTESVTDAVLAFIDSVPPGREDGPQLVLARCAVRLAQAIDTASTGLPGHVRELMAVMNALEATGDGEDELADMQARHHARRVALLGEAG